MAPTLFDNNPKPGDLIEIFRGLQNDWAVYIGDNNLVHFTPSSEGPGMFQALFAMLNNDTAQVRCQKVWEVVGADRYEVNNLLDDKYPHRDPYIIVTEARKMVGRVFPYSAVSLNCEHFVTKLRYGKAESQQVEQAKVGLALGATAAVAIAGFSLLGALLRDDGEEKKKGDKKKPRKRY